MVAERLGRASLGIELNPEYARIIQERLSRGLNLLEIEGLVEPTAEAAFQGSMEDFFGVTSE